MPSNVACGSNRAYYVDLGANLDPPFTLLATCIFTVDMASNRVVLGVCDPSLGTNAGVHFIGCRSNGQICFSSVDNAATNNNAFWSGSPVLGTVYNLCGMLAANNDRRICVNGDTGAIGTNSTNRGVTNPSRLVVGARYGTNGSFPHSGYIFQAAVVNRLLTNSEIVAVHKGMSPLEFGNSCIMHMNALGVSLTSTTDMRRIGAVAANASFSATDYVTGPPNLSQEWII